MVTALAAGRSDCGAPRVGPDGYEAGPGPAERRDLHPDVLARSVNGSKLAVFCDFDGTFSRQDVGGRLAQRHLPERRAALAIRYQKGEIDAWQYGVELFDGFSFSTAALDSFLSEIELDSGAKALLEWCQQADVPFRVLSDGFDYNIDKLQRIHGVRFEHASNRLRFEGDVWRVEAGGRNLECPCGTGLCKRQQIEAYRRARLDALCVHIGNGRVSDLCGAEAADIVFAKDTLSEALLERGIHFNAFETLQDVAFLLDQWFGHTSAS